MGSCWLNWYRKLRSSYRKRWYPVVAGLALKYSSGVDYLCPVWAKHTEDEMMSRVIAKGIALHVGNEIYPYSICKGNPNVIACALVKEYLGIMWSRRIQDRIAIVNSLSTRWLYLFPDRDHHTKLKSIFWKNSLNSTNNSLYRSSIDCPCHELSFYINYLCVQILS